jgi:hypothetical protein
VCVCVREAALPVAQPWRAQASRGELTFHTMAAVNISRELPGVAGSCRELPGVAGCERFTADTLSGPPDRPEKILVESFVKYYMLTILD